jgi:hypothetical protein
MRLGPTITPIWHDTDIVEYKIEASNCAFCGTCQIGRNDKVPEEDAPIRCRQRAYRLSASEDRGLRRERRHLAGCAQTATRNRPHSAMDFSGNGHSKRESSRSARL